MIFMLAAVVIWLVIAFQLVKYQERARWRREFNEALKRIQLPMANLQKAFAAYGVSMKQATENMLKLGEAFRRDNG